MWGHFSIPSNLLPAVHGGGDAGAGLLGLLDSFLGAVEKGIGSGSAWNPIAGISALGSNLHPMIVHFPIAFLAGFLFCEVLGLALRRPGVRRVATGMLYFGAVSAVIAATAGLIAANSVPHGQIVHEIMEWHERLGLLVAFLSIGLAVWRGAALPQSPMARAFHLTVASVVGVCLFFGADLGGLMVYQYGVGVKALQSAADSVQHTHSPAIPPSADGIQSDLRVEGATPPVMPSPTTSELAPTTEHHHHHHHHHSH